MFTEIRFRSEKPPKEYGLIEQADSFRWRGQEYGNTNFNISLASPPSSPAHITSPTFLPVSASPSLVYIHAHPSIFSYNLTYFSHPPLSRTCLPLVRIRSIILFSFSYIYFHRPFHLLYPFYLHISSSLLHLLFMLSPRGMTLMASYRRLSSSTSCRSVGFIDILSSCCFLLYF